MNGMSFLYPAFLLGAAAVAIPIVLHLLTREAAPRLPFSAVKFLKRSPVEDSRRRLRELLLLALRVTALLLLAWAFARPFLADASSVQGSGVTIVAVDTSFSMGAPGQFERAKTLAREAIRKTAPGASVGVVAFADTAEIVAKPTASHGQALAAVDRLQSGFGGTRYAAAIMLAAEQMDRNPGRIVLVTDLQKAGWDISPEATIPSTVTLEIADVGAPPDNLAVVDVRSGGGDLTAVVRNSGSQAISSRARLSVDGKPAGELTITAGPDASTEVRFAGRASPNGAAAVSIDDPRGFLADNMRYIVLDPPDPVQLLGVTVLGNAGTEAFYLERALAVTEPMFVLTTLSVADLSEMSSIDSAPPPSASDSPAAAREYAAVLLLGTRGLDRRGRELLEHYVENGGALFVVAGPDVDADAPARIFGTIRLRARAPERPAIVSLAPTDSRHPIFKPFGLLIGNLGQVRFQRTVIVDDAEGAKVAARFSNGAPALLEYQVGQGRVVYFTSDLNRKWSDFPLHPTFVPFVQEIVRYLTTSREAPREYVIADAPPGVPREPGVISLPTSRSANPTRVTRRPPRVAINVDARESDSSRIGAQRLVASVRRVASDPAAVSAAADQTREERQHLWQYGLALMLVSLVCESALGRRM